MAGEKVTQFDEETQLIAMNILAGASESTYEFIRNKFRCLPSSKTVHKWMSLLTLSDGPIETVFAALKSTSLSARDYNGLLVMDETAISPGFRFDFSGQHIDGSVSSAFQDEQNENLPANKLLLFIYKSIFSGKKVPIAFYFTRNTRASKLKSVTDELIIKLEDSGIKIHGLVSDMASINVSLWKEFGAKCDFNDTLDVNQCSSVHPCDFARKLFFSPDYEHILKNIRNFLLEYDFKFNKSDVGSIVPVKALITLEEQGIIPKMTDLNASHVFMKNSFVKMKVKPAVELFDMKTKDSLLLVQRMIESTVDIFTPEEVKKIKTSFPGTIKLFSALGDLVEILFSETVLNENNLKLIDITANSILNGRFISSYGSTDSRPKPSQFGLKLFSLAASSLYNYMHEFLQLDGSIKFQNINSACVENSFSQIKDIYTHPTASQAKQSIKWLIVTEMNLKKSRNSASVEEKKLLSHKQIFESAKSINKML